MLERTQIVSNGCCGMCCTNFSLQYSLEDLKLMMAAWDRMYVDGVNQNNNPDNEFIDSHGRVQKIIFDKDLRNMIDMLIPLGLEEVELNGNYSYTELVEGLIEGAIYAGDVKDKETALQSSLLKQYVRIGDKFFKNKFTCRHFDTVNRICGNYENRPGMCKSFGVGCKYSGCGYNKEKSELDEERITK